MKTVIITGGNGNLGLAVIQKFLDSGYNVVATVINDAAKKDLPVHKNLQTDVVNLTNEGETASFIASIIDKYKKVDAALMLVVDLQLVILLPPWEQILKSNLR